MNDRLVFLGVLAARTAQGRRAVAASLAGAVEAHHLVDAGLVAGSRAVEDWLLGVGISPDEAHGALPPEWIARSILVPAIGDRTLVVAHADLDVNLVGEIVSELGRIGRPAIVSGLDPASASAPDVNGAAGRRAAGLAELYGRALEASRISPAPHVLSGTMANGSLASLSVDGPFAKGDWTLVDEEDGLFAALTLSGLAGSARFVVKDGPAAGALTRLADDAGLTGRLAA